MTLSFLKGPQFLENLSEVKLACFKEARSMSALHLILAWRTHLVPCPTLNLYTSDTAQMP